ncbi:MAG: hypothetical protein K6G04_01735 [Lachnospiraceae bacterium]|nr:hypothetical protein [Lachnospiraceae bacterium]
MDSFITQIVGPTATTSRKREDKRKEELKKKEGSAKKEAETFQEQYAAVYVHGESEAAPITYQRPKQGPHHNTL